MTVLLTGASGFLGIHVLRRLLEDDHRVRAFVRTPARLHEHLAALGVDPDDKRVEVAVGDMTDADSVREAAQGCDRAIHAAATYSYHRADAERMQRENMTGTATVLDAAIAAGCTGIVHVSSIVALLRQDATIDHQSPLGEAVGPYTRSKVESERVARERSEAGAPVAIVNPGAIIGPHDPYLGESNGAVRDILVGKGLVWPRGSLTWTDVRDSADVVVTALEQPGRRFMVPGEKAVLPHVALREVTGRRLPAVAMPLVMVLPVAELGYRTGWPFLPHAVEGARVICKNITVDATATRDVLGIGGRPLLDSFRETVAWLVAAGHLSPKAAGTAVG